MSAPLVGQVTLTGTATVLSATPVNAEAFGGAPSAGAGGVGGNGGSGYVIVRVVG